MSGVSAASAARASESVRSQLRDTETDFGEVLTAIAHKLYPPPNTAAQVAAEIPCSVRLVEMYFGGQQEWSDTAVAFIVGEILRRKRMRNFKVTSKR